MKNREIKFRAWDGSKMIYNSIRGEYDDFYTLTLQGEFYGHTRTGDEYFNYDEDETNKLPYTLMQYTGLNDKLGNDLYEGDIVEFLYKHPESAEKLRPVRCVIFWHPEGAWCLKWPGKQEYLNGARLNPEKYTKIGDIYQNPELLTQEK